MEINILVVQHKKSHVIDSNILKPITCGNYKELNKLSDSTGERISELNDEYYEIFIISNNVSEIWSERVKSIEKNYKNISINIVNSNRFMKNKKISHLYENDREKYFKL